MIALICLLIISTYVFIDGFKNYHRCLNNVYVLILMIPLSYIDGFNTIQALKIGYISVHQAIIIEIFLIGLLRCIVKKQLIIRKSIVNHFALLLLFIYFINLVINIENQYAIKDASTYIVPLMLFFAYSFFDRKTDLNGFIELTLKALKYHSFILLAVYFTFWQLIGGNSRFGITSESLYVFSIPLMFKAVLGNTINKKTKIQYINSIIAQFFLILVSQTRSLIITIALMLVLSIITLFRKRKDVIKGIILLASSFTALFLFYRYVLMFGSYINGWANRMYELISSGFSTQSNTIRKRLINYYMPEIIHKPFGHGFGYIMRNWELTNSGLTLSSENTLGVDNLFLTYLFKFGFLVFIVFLLIYISAYYRLYFFSVKNSTYGNVVFYAFLIMLLPVALMSGQMMDDIVVACFFWTFAACSVNTSIGDNKEKTDI